MMLQRIVALRIETNQTSQTFPIPIWQRRRSDIIYFCEEAKVSGAVGNVS
jgi:hypothetical protein